MTVAIASEATGETDESKGDRLRHLLFGAERAERAGQLDEAQVQCILDLSP